MSGETAPSLPDFGSLERGRFSYLPVAPGRLEFALEVRKRILETRPEVVAVELPETLEPLYLDGIRRLPQISVIFYEDGDQAVYNPIEPTDPFIEAVRTAQEIGARVVFADPDTSERPHLLENYPDTYSLRFIALRDYVEAWRVYPPERSPDVERFAEGIAW